MPEDTNEKNIGKLFQKAEETNIKVAELSILVKQGFKGVHSRQDITNGRIGELEQDTEAIETLAEANARRLDEKDVLDKEEKDKETEKIHDRKWLKKEIIVSVLSVLQVVLTTVALVLLGLKS